MMQEWSELSAADLDLVAQRSEVSSPWSDAQSAQGWLDAAANRVAEAVRANSARVLSGLQDELRRGYAELQLAATEEVADSAAIVRGQEGQLRALAEVVRWGLEEALRAEAQRAVEPGSRAEAFLLHLHGHPGANNAELSAALGGEGKLDEGQLSRLGSRVLAQGLVERRRQGRSNVWSLTPRGRRAIAGAVKQQSERQLMQALQDTDSVMVATSAQPTTSLDDEIAARGMPAEVVFVSGGGLVAYRQSEQTAGSTQDAADLSVDSVAGAQDAPKDFVVHDSVHYARVGVGLEVAQ